MSIYIFPSSSSKGISISISLFFLIFLFLPFHSCLNPLPPSLSPSLSPISSHSYSLFSPSFPSLSSTFLSPSSCSSPPTTPNHADPLHWSTCSPGLLPPWLTQLINRLVVRLVCPFRSVSAVCLVRTFGMICLSRPFRAIISFRPSRSVRPIRVVGSLCFLVINLHSLLKKKLACSSLCWRTLGFNIFVGVTFSWNFPLFCFCILCYIAGFVCIGQRLLFSYLSRLNFASLWKVRF